MLQAHGACPNDLARISGQHRGLGMPTVWGDNYAGCPGKPVRTISTSTGPIEIIRQGGAMPQKYLLEKAAVCARAAEATSNQTKREMLTNLQKWWISLANENPLIDDRVAEQIAKLEAICADLDVDIQ
jgi:hypothetical protein